MDKDYVKGLKQGSGILTIFLVTFSVYAIGFHQSSDILPGMLQGNYTFNGSVEVENNFSVKNNLNLNGSIKINSKNKTCNSNTNGSIQFQNGTFLFCSGDDWEKSEKLVVQSPSTIYKDRKESSGIISADGKCSYTFATGITLDKGTYRYSVQFYDYDATNEISLQLDGPKTIDLYGQSIINSEWASQYGTVTIPKSGSYDIKGVQHADCSSNTWGVRYPALTPYAMMTSIK